MGKTRINGALSVLRRQAFSLSHIRTSYLPHVRLWQRTPDPILSALLHNLRSPFWRKAELVFPENQGVTLKADNFDKGTSKSFQGENLEKW